MELNFNSDNEAPVAPAIFEAILKANEGTAWSYAEDQWSARLDAAFSDLFGTHTAVVPLVTGTAANSIALASVTQPWGAVYCHSGAHIFRDEGGAPEFFGNGLRLMPVTGADGKLAAADLHEAIRSNEGHGVHSYTASTFSLTQSTEAGTVYQPEEVAALCDVAAGFGMARHMDGARFANAVATLGCSPSATTWQAGIQLLSFGAAKNGCMGAEALLIFGDAAWRERAERFRKRSGHLLSKMRYVSAQLLAYIENDLWLNLARHANAQAAQFAAAVQAHPRAKLEYTVQANEVFVRWTPAGFAALRETGIQFFNWPGHDDLARFVFSHHCSAADTQQLCRTLGQVPG